MFHNNIVKISENLNKQNLLKICLQAIYPTDFCIILHAFLLWEKVKKKNNDKNKTFCA